MFQKSIKKAIIAGLTLAVAPVISLATPPAQGTPDLAPASITFKTKIKDGVESVKNFTLLVDNLGDGKAENTRLHYYLSDDDVLSTETDLLFHQHSLGAVKVGKTKKKTVGGGVLKQAGAVSGQYVLAVVDAEEAVEELDEENNVVVSPVLP